jgi:hypothetical protein
MRKKITVEKIFNGKKSCSKPCSEDPQTDPNFAPMNFRTKALNHIDAAKDALLRTPVNEDEWKRLRDELHCALEAVILAEHAIIETAAHEPPEIQPEPESQPKVEVPARIPNEIVSEIASEIKQNPEPEIETEPEIEAGKSIAEALSDQRIASIQDTLSINDRVRFAGDLCDGDIKALLTLCGELEQMTSYVLAAAHLDKQVTQGVDWDNEEGAPFEFLQRLRRLFA